MDETGSLSSGKPALLDLEFLKNNTTAALANFVQPIFTTFVALLARTEMKASVFELGLIGGGASIVYTFMPFVMGRFSDRGQARKFFIILSLALLALVSVLYSYSANPIDLIALRFVEGLGWAAFWPAIDSAVTHDTKVDPKRALAIFNLSWSFAASLGPFLGAFVVVLFSIRQVFIFNALFLLVAMSIYLFPFSRVRRSERPAPVIESGGKVSARAEPVIDHVENSAMGKSSTKVLRTLFYILSLVICSITSNTMLSFFSPYANSQALPVLVIGAVSGTFSAARFLGYLLTSNRRINNFLLDPRIRGRNIIAFLVFAVLASLLMVLPSSSGGIYFLSFGLVGLGYSFVYYVAMVGLLAETRRERMGAGAGIFENSIGMGSFAGPVIAGSVSGNSLTIPFIVPSICAIPILGYLIKESRSKK
ncbi:MAG: MFS transporter [Thaumarchaeota archaeon]|nr:MFS transporter [Nitrososphaerota archaeon]